MQEGRTTRQEGNTGKSRKVWVDIVVDIIYYSC